MVDNNPANLVDIDERRVCDCIKALAELTDANVNLNRRVVEAIIDRKGTGLNDGHKQAIDDAINRVNNAMRKVVQDCWDTAAAAAALAAAAEAIQVALPFIEEAAAVLIVR